MKVYRAVFEYNNADSCEWERWYAEKSSWYLNKEIAEKHIPTLEEFRDYLCDYYRTNCCFHYKDPYIEEQDILDEFVPINLKTLEDKPFTGFEYKDYNEPIELTKRELRVNFPVGRNNWCLVLYVGNKCFNVCSNGDVYEEKTEDTNYYKYPTEIKEKFIKVCKDYYESIRSVSEAFTKKI